jgi:Zn-dependent protease
MRTPPAYDRGGAASRARCPTCGSEVAPALLSCPGCHRLVHAEALRALADEAERATSADSLAEALTAWRRALELLPPGSRQHGVIEEKVRELSRRTEAAPLSASSRPVAGTAWARWLTPLGAAGLLLWKFKFIAVFVLTKAKLLLLGLVKAPTLFSMLLSFGVYWTAWGWKFALGLIASMYVHEMGHVFALSRYGIRATAPMFIPGLGAFVRMEQYPTNTREDARVGLAGPTWGLLAAAFAYAVSLLTGWAAWAATARAAAWLNLFNLLPLGFLDGGRGFRSLTRSQRLLAAGGIAAAWAFSHESLLGLIFFAAAGRAIVGRGAESSDGGALLQYLGLVGVLTALTTIRVGLG